MSDAANRWTEFYTKSTEIMYPAEAVIRIFKGTYPGLKMPKPEPGQSILDVGFGDGRHFPLFHQLGLRISGTEITREIVEATARRLDRLDLTLDVGTCADLPFEDRAFDWLLTWNSCYYMNTHRNLGTVQTEFNTWAASTPATFEDHVAEMARVLKPGGWIVCSVPKETCFIFDGAEWLKEGYVTIRNDYFGLRNGEVMRRFRTRLELESEFGGKLNPDGPFTNFCHASIDIDMFGLAYNWHVIVAQRT